MMIWEPLSLGDPKCLKQSSGTIIWLGSIVASKGNRKITLPTFAKILMSLANHPEYRSANNRNSETE